MLGYWALRFFQFVFRITPFWMLYSLSDFFAFFFHRIIRYRRSVILGNLTRCFPNSTADERNKIAKDFYLNFTDIFIESLKGLSISKADLLKRYEMIWQDMPPQFNHQPRQFVASAGHFSNWEWGVLSMAIYFKGHNVLGIYKQISNKKIDDYLRKLRGQYGMVLAPTYLTRTVVPRYAEKPMVMFLVGDQNPSNPKKGFWVPFFNEPVSTLAGIELYAKQFNMPVYYFKIDRIKRGYYQIKAELLIENPAGFAPGEITALYMQRIENHIIENPSQWLWSHKRWKHKLPEGVPVVLPPK